MKKEELLKFEGKNVHLCEKADKIKDGVDFIDYFGICKVKDNTVEITQENNEVFNIEIDKVEWVAEVNK